MSLGASWGVTGSERLAPFPCDARCAAPDEALFRGVTVAAPPPLLFRWLCQLRTAPYSYDWLDNGGRQSPRTLTPGLDVLAKGQRVMTIFEDRSLTIVNLARGGARRLFGEVWVSYVIRPGQGEDCRLLAKLVVRYPRAITGWALRRVLPLGDLVMMRRQLLNLKKLAERDARGAA
jgi:hypothetical protein